MTVPGQDPPYIFAATEVWSVVVVNVRVTASWHDRRRNTYNGCSSFHRHAAGAEGDGNFLVAEDI